MCGTNPKVLHASRALGGRSCKESFICALGFLSPLGAISFFCGGAGGRRRVPLFALDAEDLMLLVVWAGAVDVLHLSFLRRQWTSSPCLSPPR